MTIGEKIRQARQEKGLSQRQLCGDQVTRNMLSQIENGAARPSMDTLSYFAARLGRPISYFLDEDALSTPNHGIMKSARAAYAAGDYSGAMAILGDYRGPDDVFDPEKALLQNLCLLEEAKKAEAREQLPYATQLLDRVDKDNLYYTATTQRQHHLAMGLLPAADDRELLLRAENALSGGDAQRALTYLAAAEDPASLRWNLLRGMACFAIRDYENAITCLQIAERSDPRTCLPMLESCFRELQDFENAYRCACKLREL